MPAARQKNSLSGTLIFLHIPKTAGSTFTALLKRLYDESVIYQIKPPFYNKELSRLKNLPIDQKIKAKLIVGHMPFGIHKYFPSSCGYITILRKPVERVISHYYFVKSDRKHPLHRIVNSQRMSLSEYVQSKISAEIQNGQTRILCGLDEVPWFGPYADACPEAAFIAARRNLNSFKFVGLQESFSESVALLNKQFGWSLPFNFKSVNITRKKNYQELSLNDIRTVEKYNEYDIELYRIARSLFFEKRESLQKDS